MTNSERITLIIFQILEENCLTDNLNLYWLERDLYDFKENPKYNSLLSEFEIKQNCLGNTLELISVVDLLEKHQLHFEIVQFEDKKIRRLVVDHKIAESYMEETKLIRQLVEEYKTRRLIEKESSIPTFIKGIDPNRDYFTISANTEIGKVEWNLLTDGQYKELEDPIQSADGVIENPLKYEQCLSSSSIDATQIDVVDANYTIFQGRVNEQVKQLRVYTLVTDPVELKKISQLGISSTDDLKIKKIKY